MDTPPYILNPRIRAPGFKKGDKWPEHVVTDWRDWVRDPWEAVRIDGVIYLEWRPICGQCGVWDETISFFRMPEEYKTLRVRSNGRKGGPFLAVTLDSVRDKLHPRLIARLEDNLNRLAKRRGS